MQCGIEVLETGMEREALYFLTSPHSEEIASDSFNQTRSGNEGENLKHLFQHFQLRHMSIYAYAYAGQYLVFFSISTLFCCNKISSLADQVDWAQRVTE